MLRIWTADTCSKFRYTFCSFFSKFISRNVYSEVVHTELNSIVVHFYCTWAKKNWTAVKEVKADKHLTKSELWSVKSWTYILLSSECRSPLPIYVWNRTSLLSWKLPGLRNGNWVNCTCVLHINHIAANAFDSNELTNLYFCYYIPLCTPLFPGK